MRIARSTIAASAAALVLAAASTSVAAQGSLSTQGFGYPPGQVSARASGAGSGNAEIDALSPINPAALINWGASAVFLQTEPEFRTVRAGGQELRTTTWRYPLVMGALSVGPRAIVALSSSTLLDRTWSTTEEADIDVEARAMGDVVVELAAVLGRQVADRERVDIRVERTHDGDRAA